MNLPILTSLVLLPVVGAVLSLVVGRGRESLARQLALELRCPGFLDTLRRASTYLAAPEANTH